MIILGLDPGLANLGYAIVDLQPFSEDLLHAGVITTKPDTRKKGVLVANDNFRRLERLTLALEVLFNDWDIKALCTEAMSIPNKNFDSATKLSMSWGVIAAIAKIHELPVVQAPPQFIKKELCGKRNATKLEVEEALVKRYPNCEDVLKKTTFSLRDHAADAYAAVIVSLESDMIRMMRKML